MLLNAEKIHLSTFYYKLCIIILKTFTCTLHTDTSSEKCHMIDLWNNLSTVYMILQKNYLSWFNFVFVVSSHFRELIDELQAKVHA